MDCFITDYGTSRLPGSDSAALEDSIMHKGRPVTAGSKILENFISPIDATVVTRLEDAGVTILGKTKMDEFGTAGLFADATAVTSGAVSAVADGIAAFALCNDYTGSVRKQAAEQGICHIHPTYGTVSRYGLISAVSSMDQIGALAKKPAECFRVLALIAGHDAKDGAMYTDEGLKDTKVKFDPLKYDKTLKVGLPVNVLASTNNSAAVTEFFTGFDLVEFELKYFDVFGQIMQILCCAEISASLSRYDGIKFGYRAADFRNLRELYTKSRTEAFGRDAKLASIIGAMTLSQQNYARYYDKAMRIRRLIKESLEFDKYDIIAMPVPYLAYSLNFGALPQLCGLPALTLPFDGGGLALIANALREDVLCAFLRQKGLD